MFDWTLNNPIFFAPLKFFREWINIFLTQTFWPEAYPPYPALLFYLDSRWIAACFAGRGGIYCTASTHDSSFVGEKARNHQFLLLVRSHSSILPGAQCGDCSRARVAPKLASPANSDLRSEFGIYWCVCTKMRSGIGHMITLNCHELILITELIQPATQPPQELTTSLSDFD